MRFHTIPHDQKLNCSMVMVMIAAREIKALVSHEVDPAIWLTLLSTCPEYLYHVAKRIESASTLVI